MSEKNKNYYGQNGENGLDTSWIPVFVMLVVFWPVGLGMLFNKIKRSSSPEQKRRKPLSWTSIALIFAGFAMMNSYFSSFGVFALLGGGALFAYSRKMKGEERLFNKYANVIGTRTVMPISAIAAAMPVSFEQATKDLQKMIDNGYFGQHAYLDMDSNNFVSDSRFASTYVERLKKKYEHVLAKSESEPAPVTAPEPVKIDPRSEIEKEFQEKLDAIRAINERIKDEDISAKIYRIEEITGGIFELCKEKPQKRAAIHTFMNYYLPTTLKLLDSYSVLERQNVLGQNIISTKANIEKMVDQLVWAFEQQLDQMFESEAKDISTDITVLERMMARDGLSENPYTLPKRPSKKADPSPFSGASDFGTAQAVQQQEDE